MGCKRPTPPSLRQAAASARRTSQSFGWVRDHWLVRKKRLELSRVTPLEPKSSASTNSATFARVEPVSDNTPWMMPLALNGDCNASSPNLFGGS